MGHTFSTTSLQGSRLCVPVGWVVKVLVPGGADVGLHSCPQNTSSTVGACTSTSTGLRVGNKSIRHIHQHRYARSARHSAGQSKVLLCAEIKPVAAESDRNSFLAPYHMFTQQLVEGSIGNTFSTTSLQGSGNVFQSVSVGVEGVGGERLSELFNKDAHTDSKKEHVGRYETVNRCAGI